MAKIKEELLFKYTKEEDRLNVITHVFGVVACVIGLIYLLLNNRGESFIIQLSIVVYILSSMALFLASSLYHYEQDPNRRGLYKRLDHSMILVMISGTYVPFCVLINTTASYAILVIVYILSIIGIALKVKFINISSKISIIIYIVVGWLSALLVREMYTILGPEVLMFTIAGGITYTVGAILYAFANFKYHHALWHVIVLLAAGMFFLAINCAYNL